MTDSHRSPTPVRAGRSERWLPLAWMALIAGGVTLFAVGLGHLVPPCGFKLLTGLYCPGCGSGRVARALLALDPAAAWRANPAVLVALPFTAYALVRETLHAWAVVELPWPKTRGSAWIWTLLAVIVAFWVARNIPGWPFELLAPR